MTNPDQMPEVWDVNWDDKVYRHIIAVDGTFHRQMKIHGEFVEVHPKGGRHSGSSSYWNPEYLYAIATQLPGHVSATILMLMGAM
jgi:hypothetical protein